jgi:hypothetical protein
MPIGRVDVISVRGVLIATRIEARRPRRPIGAPKVWIGAHNSQQEVCRIHRLGTGSGNIFCLRRLNQIAGNKQKNNQQQRDRDEDLDEGCAPIFLRGIPPLHYDYAPAVKQSSGLVIIPISPVRELRHTLLETVTDVTLLHR